jgi:hypothetical protein
VSCGARIRIVTVHVCEHTLSIELVDDIRTVRRMTTKPVVVIKGSAATSALPRPIDRPSQRASDRRTIPNRSRS